MKQFGLYIMTLKDNFGLEICEDAIDYNQLFLIFLSPDMEVIVQMTEEMRIKYNQFIDKYKNSHKKILAFKKNLDAINVGEYFFITGKKITEAKDVAYVNNLLITYSFTKVDSERAKLFQTLCCQTSDVFGRIFEHYQIFPFDSSLKIFTGEYKTERRVCRFCNNENKEGKSVTFKKRAHIIPEALGNKGLIANEECDNCNEKFGRTIEKKLIDYFIHRAILGVDGKRGKPMLRFNNNAVIKYLKKDEINQFEHLPEEAKNKDMVVIISNDINFNKETKEITAKLETNNKIDKASIYKALCKIVIGLLDSSNLHFLKKTISWINSSGEEQHILPLIAHSEVNNFGVKYPVVYLYIRKSNDYRLPHILCHLSFPFSTYIFIVPFSQEDKLDFTKKENYDYFWNFFIINH